MVASYPIENQAFNSIERCTSIRRKFKSLILSQSEATERDMPWAGKKYFILTEKVILYPLFQMFIFVHLSQNLR